MTCIRKKVFLLHNLSCWIVYWIVCWDYIQCSSEISGHDKSRTGQLSAKEIEISREEKAKYILVGNILTCTIVFECT